MTNTELLRKRIDESGYKLRYIAKQVGITYQALLNKMNNETEFKAGEINVMCELLHITDMQEMKAIFFAENVGK